MREWIGARPNGTDRATAANSAANRVPQYIKLFVGRLRLFVGEVHLVGEKLLVVAVLRGARLLQLLRVEVGLLTVGEGGLLRCHLVLTLCAVVLHAHLRRYVRQALGELALIPFLRLLPCRSAECTSACHGGVIAIHGAVVVARHIF